MEELLRPRVKRLAAALGLALISMLGVVGCGVEGPGSGAPGAIAPYITLEDDFLTATSSELTGSGIVRMSETLGGLWSSESFHLRMDLLEEGSSVTLVAHSGSSDLSLGQGIQVTFERTGIDSLEITTYSSNSIAYSAQAAKISTYRVDLLNVIVDVLADDSDARVLIWRDTVPRFDATASDVDTDDYPDKISLPGPVFLTGGLSWGLRLNNASVFYAQKDESKLIE